MALLYGVTEKAFKQLAQQLHRRLLDQGVTTLSLTQVQEMLSQSLGLGSLALLKQHWRLAPTLSGLTMAQPPAPPAQDLLMDLTAGNDGERTPLSTWFISGDWLNLPRIFREAWNNAPSDDERRRALRSWHDAMPLFREGVQAANEGLEALVAWAKAHPEADHWEVKAHINRPEFMPVNLSLLLIAVHRVEWYEALVVEAGWRSFEQAPLDFGPLIWGHPQATLLLSLVPLDQLWYVLTTLSGSLPPPGDVFQNEQVSPNQALRKTWCAPVLTTLAALVNQRPKDVRLHLAWERLLENVEHFVTGDQESAEEIPLSLEERKLWQRLPEPLFRYRMPRLVSPEQQRQLLAQVLPFPLWLEALTALEGSLHENEPKTWEAWLTRHRELAQTLEGPAFENDAGTGLRQVPLVTLVKGKPYEIWLRLGLPPHRPAGEEGLTDLWARLDHRSA